MFENPKGFFLNHRQHEEVLNGKKEKKNQEFIERRLQKINSNQKVQLLVLNDDEEAKMILDEKMNEKSNISNNIPIIQTGLISTALPIKQVQHDFEVHNFTFINVNLKSTILLFLLLSLLTFSLYQVIHQVYQIQHPMKSIPKSEQEAKYNLMMKQDNFKAKQQINIMMEQDRFKVKQQIDNHNENQKKGKQQIQSQDEEKKGNYQNNEINQQKISKQNNVDIHLQALSTSLQDKENESIKRKKNIYIKQELAASNKEDAKQIEIQYQSRQNHDLTKELSLEDKSIQKAQIHSFLKPNLKQISSQILSSSNFALTPNSDTFQKYLQNPKTQTNTLPKKKLTNEQKKRIARQQRIPPKPDSKINSEPLPKAGITTEQALKWAKFERMIELPLGAEIKSDPMLQQEYNHFQKKYNISKFHEIPICVVVPTYNNVKNDRYKDNIKSILQQNYTNFHVVVIDDNSDDSTGNFIQKYINQMPQVYKQKVKIIFNQERKMAMFNLRYAAINQCKDNQLFIIVDGDDLLIGRQVFKLFSAVMQQRNLWVMWSNFLSPKGSIGYSRQYNPYNRKFNNYRKAGFVMSHLRAYYTKLFRLIKQQDLQDKNGEYFRAANDVAIGIPILEMAHEHTGYVPEISYYYNLNTGLNNHQVRLKEQKNNDREIRQKDKYQPLKSLSFLEEKKIQKEDVPQKIEQIESGIDRQNRQQNIKKISV